jgi:hypothetical protein
MAGRLILAHTTCFVPARSPQFAKSNMERVRSTIARMDARACDFGNGKS